MFVRNVIKKITISFKLALVLSVVLLTVYNVQIFRTAYNVMKITDIFNRMNNVDDVKLKTVYNV